VARFFWRPKPKGETSVHVATFREILETLAFVVVLVLLLKTFVAEAFVIPTGSMATTLYGYNKEVTCPQCGHVFHVNCSDEVEKAEHPLLTNCTCENCFLLINFGDRPEEVRSPSASSGDRVLVAKFLADLHLKSYRPLDVVVFKFPEGPVKNHVPMNYIKRLIGLPDQVIGIYYGDIYVATREDLEKLGVRFDGDEHVPIRRRLLKNQPKAKELLESGNPCFIILRKPPPKILAMMRHVYDNDHPAADLVKDGFPARWHAEVEGPVGAQSGNLEYVARRKMAPADAWILDGDPDGPHGFRCGRNQDANVWLRYRHLLRPPDNADLDRKKQPIAQLITDFMSYNSGNLANPTQGNRWVGDLILECEVTLKEAQGELTLELCKGPDRFRARWDLDTGTCTLRRGNLRGRNLHWEDLTRGETAMNKPGTYRLRFANVDRRLTVWVDNELPFGDGFAYDPPRETVDGETKIVRRPTKNDLEPASIGTRGGPSLTVNKLKLFRDTYYLNDQNESLRKEVIEDPGKWRDQDVDIDNKKDAPEGLTMYVQPGHYLCLGDNSPSSSDSRVWSNENEGNNIPNGGLVPEHLMLGRALAIYFPFYRFGRIQ
jgi:signal peptidase I